MPKLPEFDPIEYLVLRRFPSAKALRAPSISYRGGEISYVDRQSRLDQVAAYERELEIKSPAELQELVDRARAEDAAERFAKAEREEQQRFYNQPYTNANFSHWSKAAHWSLDEAIALSFGKEPEWVSWKRLSPLPTPLLLMSIDGAVISRCEHCPGNSYSTR